MKRGSLTTGTFGFLLGAICGAGAMRLLPSGEKDASGTDAGLTTPARAAPAEAAKSATPSPPPEILADPTAPPGSPEALLAAAEEFDADRAREARERTANDLAVWEPFYTSLLELTPAQAEALHREASPALMGKLLRSSNFLTAPQREKLEQFEKERVVNYSEATAQRQMAWVQERLPLTSPDKDRLWQLLSAHAFSLTEAGADLGKQDEAKQRLRAEITAILPPAAAGVALSYLEAGMEDPPPGMEEIPEGDGEPSTDPAAEESE